LHGALRNAVIQSQLFPTWLIVKYPLWISLAEVTVASLVVTLLILVLIKILHHQLSYRFLTATALVALIAYGVVTAARYDYAWPDYPLSPVIAFVQLANPVITIALLLLMGVFFVAPTTVAPVNRTSPRLQLGVVHREHAQRYGELMRAALRLYPKHFESDEQSVANATTQSITTMLAETNDENGFVLGAFTATGNLIGTVRVARRDGVKSRHIGEVFFAYTDPSHQRVGVDKMLLQASIDGARRLTNLLQLYVSVSITDDTDNDWTIAAYTAAGFVSTGVLRRSLMVSGEFIDQELLWLPLYK
jgi:ribosomal protein S18 acetylase RimI-like enzyme